VIDIKMMHLTLDEVHLSFLADQFMEQALNNEKELPFIEKKLGDPGIPVEGRAKLLSSF
jgi:hypothetical protein